MGDEHVALLTQMRGPILKNRREKSGSHTAELGIGLSWT